MCLLCIGIGAICFALMIFHNAGVRGGDRG